MARLSKGAENPISMPFVLMCAEKIWRLLRLFLSPFCLVKVLAMSRLPLDGAQEHLEALSTRFTGYLLTVRLSCLCLGIWCNRIQRGFRFSRDPNLELLMAVVQMCCSQAIFVILAS